MGGTDSYDSGARPYDLPETSPYGTPAVGPPTPVYGTPPVGAGGVVPVHPVPPQDMAVYPPAATTPPPPWATLRTNQVQVSGGGIAVAWIVTFFSSLYMLPWAIAMTRGKADRWGIFWLNFLTGWTVVGWIWAFIWSCLPHRVIQAGPVPVPPGWYPLANGRHAFWDGTRWTGHVA
ncbi:superinfection immunity protein [Cellulomonas persica]|uniref:DUF2510 domain-containing protein n=1 Tax=Cellulomonas persica TaxID=76861 RepID=A0A510UVT0_9CELL|nr:superinfection immunity protein [Cellulomonas persica]GEK18792.1 hypothetical protein CPE01_25250 [Cellulomonas persica]